MLKGKRDRELGSITPSEQERFLSGRQNLMITLMEKPGELFTVNSWLREDSLKLKWQRTGKVGTGEVLMWLYTKPIVNLKHSKWSFFMQTNGLVKLKWKNQRIFEE